MGQFQKQNFLEFVEKLGLWFPKHSILDTEKTEVKYQDHYNLELAQIILFIYGDS